MICYRTIISLRDSKGLTQEQIADKMNCTRQKYARLEKDLIDISYSSISTIAQILGVRIEEIILSVNSIGKVDSILVYAIVMAKLCMCRIVSEQLI